MSDKTAETLVLALRLAVNEPGEHRLFKSGKLAGLFPGRNGASAEAATRALQEGFLEVVRTETKGKTNIEWVRLTPRGVDFLHAHQSPVQVLEELRAVLETNRDALPVWLAQMQQEFGKLSARIGEQVQAWTDRLETLSRRVEESLRRADAGNLHLPSGAEAGVPWALDALAYLDRRRSVGMTGDCPLPELFAALNAQYADLSISAFHDGLRRLSDRRALQLRSFAGSTKEPPEPEYALLDGPAILYYAAR